MVKSILYLASDVRFRYAHWKVPKKAFSAPLLVNIQAILLAITNNTSKKQSLGR